MIFPFRVNTPEQVLGGFPITGFGTSSPLCKLHFHALRSITLCTLTPVYSFYNQAHKKVQHLGESFAKMEDAYREACLMFSERPKNIDPTDFFCLFQNFIKEWKVVADQRSMSVAVAFLILVHVFSMYQFVL